MFDESKMRDGKIDPLYRERLMDSVAWIQGFIRSLPVNKSCESCSAWDGKGCAEADGESPPLNVQKIGCANWNFKDQIPY